MGAGRRSGVFDFCFCKGRNGPVTVGVLVPRLNLWEWIHQSVSFYLCLSLNMMYFICMCFFYALFVCLFNFLWNLNTEIKTMLFSFLNGRSLMENYLCWIPGWIQFNLKMWWLNECEVFVSVWWLCGNYCRSFFSFVLAVLWAFHVFERLSGFTAVFWRGPLKHCLVIKKCAQLLKVRCMTLKKQEFKCAAEHSVLLGVLVSL